MRHRTPLKSGFDGIPSVDSSDANSSQETDGKMQVELEQCKYDIDLAALHRRRRTILALIRSLERYQRTSFRPIQRRSRRAPRRLLKTDYAE